MSSVKQILILYCGGEDVLRELRELTGILRTLGAQVSLRHLATEYEEILEAIESADSVVYWR
jgi:hypothetical protein